MSLESGCPLGHDFPLVAQAVHLGSDLFEPAVFVTVRQSPLQVIELFPQTVDLYPRTLQPRPLRLLLMLEFVNEFLPAINSD